MRTDEIKKLIEAFYKGETSIEDEELLYQYFRQENVADELADEKEYFAHIADYSHSEEIPSGFSQRMDNLFDTLDEREKKTRRIWIWSGVAAVVASVILFVGYLWSGNNLDQHNLAVTDTVNLDTDRVNIPKDTIIVRKPEKETNVKKIEATAASQKLSAQIEEKRIKSKPKEKQTEKVDYKEIEEALRLVSFNWDKGVEQMEAISENISQTNKLLKDKQN